MQNIILGGGDDVHQSLIAWFLQSKALTITATTSAVTYLTAYSTDLGQAAQSVPQVINFIGTHGPTAHMSWADVMAWFSFMLVVTNLAIGLHKIGSGIISKVRVWRKKPRRRVNR
jgi:hypothetical protein